MIATEERTDALFSGDESPDEIVNILHRETGYSEHVTWIRHCRISAVANIVLAVVSALVMFSYNHDNEWLLSASIGAGLGACLSLMLGEYHIRKRNVAYERIQSILGRATRMAEARERSELRH
jgi:hypothetical protein